MGNRKLSDVIAFISKSLWRKNVSMKAWNGEQKVEHLFGKRLVVSAHDG